MSWRFFSFPRTSQAGRPWQERLLGLTGWLVNAAGIVISAGWLIALFIAHLKVIAQPGPQEFNEPTIWRATWLIDQGRNPYALKELPASAYCFDPLYNYVLVALKPVFGIDYTGHRLFNLVLLLASLALLVRVIQRAGAGLGIALLSAVFYYWMTLGNIMITARPDLLGLFFFLLGILVPWETNYDRWPTVFGLVCALVAFHCKSYYVLAACATLLGMFLLRSKREAWWLGVGFLAVLGLSFAACEVLFPYYYVETVMVQRGAAALNSSDAISMMHTLMLFDRGWPFMLMMGAGAGLWLWRREQARRTGAAVAPLLGGTAPGRDSRLLVLTVVFLIFLVLVYFYMGRNAGAFFTYHLHLLFPLMFVLAAYAAARPAMRIAFGLLLAVFVQTYISVPGVPDSAPAYRHLDQMIRNCPGEILGIASLTDIFDRLGRPVLHNGNTMYIPFAFEEGVAQSDPLIIALRDKFSRIEPEVMRKVAARDYALVFTEFDEPYFCTKELLMANYDRVEQIDYFTYFGHSPIRVWRPKPR